MEQYATIGKNVYVRATSSNVGSPQNHNKTISKTKQELGF